jgi:hypothetical protein
MSAAEEMSPIKTWAIIGGIAATFLLWGLLLFYVIKDKGPLDWDFSVVPDIPGESAYSTMNPQRPHGLAPSIEANPAEPQHVMGPPSESQQVEKQGK